MTLTLPAVEPGFRYILADGVKVGHVVDIWDDGPGHQAWEAHLGTGGKTLVRKRLADLRADLRELAEREPWWPPCPVTEMPGAER